MYVDHRDDGTSAVVLADTDGRNPTTVFVDHSIAQVVPSPDGERLAIIRVGSPGRAGTPTYLETMRDDGTCRHEHPGSFITGVDWHAGPNDPLLAYTSRVDDGSVGAGMFVEHSGPFPRRVKIGDDAAAIDPAWHPAGQGVVSSRNGDIYFNNVSGSTPLDTYHYLVGPEDDRDPVFSPDGGAHLAYLRTVDGVSRPFVQVQSNLQRRQVADVDLADVSWFDDRTLIGSRDVDRVDPGIVRIDIQTGHVTQLTHGEHTSVRFSRRGGAAGTDGYTLAAADGALFNFGSACQPVGSQDRSEAPFVAATATPDRSTIWFADDTGHVRHVGEARLYGEISTPLAQPIVGMASTPTGRGYWLVARDGGIFSFGDAVFYGSTGAMRLNQPIVGMASTPAGRGYWLVARDGGIFSFGDAAFYGSTGAIRLNAPVFSMAPTSTGRGYLLFAQDGGVFTFGDAQFYGSTGAQRLNAPITAVTPTATGGGYWIVARDGGVFTFGDARFFGSTGDVALAAPVIAGFSPKG